MQVQQQGIRCQQLKKMRWVIGAIGPAPMDRRASPSSTFVNSGEDLGEASSLDGAVIVSCRRDRAAELLSRQAFVTILVVSVIVIPDYMSTVLLLRGSMVTLRVRCRWSPLGRYRYR